MDRASPAAADAPLDTPRILMLAAELGRPALGGDAGRREARVEAFIAEYRDWVLTARGMASAREEWAEHHSILLHLMIGAATLGEALAILTRFAEPIWGVSTRHRLVDEGRTLALFLEEPALPGTEGLIFSLWLLSAMLSHFEFLVGMRLDQVTAQVAGARCIPPAAEAVLFGRPLDYGAERMALRFPKIDAHRRLIATTAQIPAFRSHHMRLTINLPPAAGGTAQIVADLIRRRLDGEPGPDCGMAAIAALLGLSASTLRRHLQAEGTSFSAIRAETQDDLTRQWLRETDWTIEHIADRIGYSDAFALRRAFHRANGVSPLAFRKRVRGGGVRSVSTSK